MGSRNRAPGPSSLILRGILLRGILHGFSEGLKQDGTSVIYVDNLLLDMVLAFLPSSRADEIQVTQFNLNFR